MDEKEFARLLDRYPPVRTADYVAPPAKIPRKKVAAASCTVEASTSASAATRDDAPARSVDMSGYSDFWSGLGSLLKAHIPDETQRRAVMQSFETMHYDLLLTLNWEDVEELSESLVALAE